MKMFGLFKIKNLFFSVLLLLLVSCETKTNRVVSDESPPVYPDYIDVTIPCNIAPLNFLLRNQPSETEVTLKGNTEHLTVKGSGSIRFPEKKWRKLLENEKGHTVNVQVSAKINGQWIDYKPFSWRVVADKIDPYLSYRLIEPGYEVWNKIQLCERRIENFDERVIADNNLTEHSCMNCHIYGNQRPDFSFFHLRGKKGGTVLNRNGELRKINIKKEKNESNPTYGNLHPSGRYGVFSANDVKNGFHTLAKEKLEVFDATSDLIILDFDNERVIRSPLLFGTSNLETFPVFSADGNSIYYCVASPVAVPDSIQQLKYSLCRIGFDAETGQWGNSIDTILYMGENDKSVSFPRPSPDGKYLLYSVSDYGTFPIWHRETDLQLLNLQSGTIDSLTVVNDTCSDTYHSWSSNSRWFVFASKRDDGLYGKPYFCYVDKEGKAHKPFVLPQKNPYFYDYNLKSFNIPELSTGKLPFDAADIEEVYWKKQTEEFQ
jgi:hypothetical protein